MPPAPARASTTIGWPRMLDIFSVTIRLIVSAGPPAGNGTMNLIGRFGNSCAARALGHATIPIKHKARMSAVIWTSSLLRQGFDPPAERLDDGLGLLGDQCVA